MKEAGARRVVIVVIDGLGVGEMPDASDYGDTGSDTLDNISRAAGGLKLPNMARLGLGLIEGVDGVEKAASPEGFYGRMARKGPGKDTSTGHWEMAGVVIKKPFATFPDGFPAELLERFSRAVGRGLLWARPASGTEIIERLGTEHMATGKLIVYTSADSVFQIAAHEEVVPVEELYRICLKARKIVDEYNIERVIARPFTGRPGSFKRTERRKDFSMGPPEETVLERLLREGVDVIGVGKIGDIFAHRGLAEEIHTAGDAGGIEATVDAIRRTKGKRALVFTNLVDFDTLYAHRNNPAGCARALEYIDRNIPAMKALLNGSDILVITGDHGCDPTTPSTDHSREYVPLLVYTGSRGAGLGTRETLADIAATVCEAFGLGPAARGRSFLSDLRFA